MARAAMFLDRDDTLIYDVGYARDPRSVCLIPGVGNALRELHSMEFLLVLISNQSGIGRGRVTPQEAALVHDRMVACLAAFGVQLDGVYYCPHAPAEQCTCRKPSPAMLYRAAQDLQIDLGKSFMVGNKPSDIEAGRDAGCRTILLGIGPEAKRWQVPPDCFAADWSEVTAFVRSEVTAVWHKL